MLKKSASLSCSFGLFGLSGLFGWLHETNQMDQTDQITRQTGLVTDVQALEVLACRHSFSEAC
jgi:hypothetical protein